MSLNLAEDISWVGSIDLLLIGISSLSRIFLQNEDVVNTVGNSITALSKNVGWISSINLLLAGISSLGRILLQNEDVVDTVSNSIGTK
ncbi:hypothetical protein ACJBU6_08140 [Exserohilum turcicum]